MTAKEKLTSIGVTTGTKGDFLNLQRKHRYKNADDFVADMVFFFENNDVSPRQKDSIQKQMGSFRESLFKKLGAFERDYYKAHYHDFNQVSGYIKEQFEVTQKMIADFGIKRGSKPIPKDEHSNEVLTPEKPTENVFEKKIAAVEYLLKNFEKKCSKQGEKMTVESERYTQFKLGLMNVLKRD
ncbi:MAG: BfmA/BtgA family mobilization protein [Bacteroidota bacterium]